MSWQACVDYTESSPAFLIIIGIPVSYSIADRFAREIGWLTYLPATVLVLYFVFVRSRIG